MILEVWKFLKQYKVDFWGNDIKFLYDINQPHIYSHKFENENNISIWDIKNSNWVLTEDPFYKEVYKVIKSGLFY